MILPCLASWLPQLDWHKSTVYFATRALSSLARWFCSGFRFLYVGHQSLKAYRRHQSLDFLGWVGCLGGLVWLGLSSTGWRFHSTPELRFIGLGELVWCLVLFSSISKNRRSISTPQPWLPWQSRLPRFVGLPGLIDRRRRCASAPELWIPRLGMSS